MRVPTTRAISIAESTLFFKPNCIGVNAKLKRRLRAKGSATISGSSLVKTL
jgi:hypothetical protein